MNAWLTEWRDSNQLGLTRQTFNTLVWTNDAIVELCSDFLEWIPNHLNWEIAYRSARKKILSLLESEWWSLLS